MNEDHFSDVIADDLFIGMDMIAEQEAIMAAEANDPVVIAWYAMLDAQGYKF